jgi:hypothetical protein
MIFRLFLGFLPVGFKTFRIFGDKTVIKVAKVDRVDAVIDEIAQRILVELEGATSADLSDILYAKKILHLADIHYARTVLEQIETKRGSGSESEIEKRAVIKVLLFSTWLQRLYFIIRSSIMGLIGSIITFLFIWSLGTINAVTSYIFGLLVFALSLAITRFFDAQLTQATKKIVEIMAYHRASRDFIMSHF